MSMLTNALSGANAAQAALDTTSQNTANLQTTGYSRQVVELGSVQPLFDGANSAGSGVSVTSIQRVSDQYTNLQLWSAASSLGESTSAQSYLTQLEQVMGDSTTGIGPALDSFSSALNAASEDPTSDPLREEVVANAQSLTQQFDTQSQLMQTQLTAVNQQQSSIVTQVNELSSDIARLNTQIVAAQGSGVNAAGLLDARDQKIDSLSSLASVQVVTQPDGAYDISLNNGQPLVEGSTASTMSATANSSGTQTLSLTFGNTSYTLSGDLGGELGGLSDFQSNVLEPMMSSISSMEQQVATAYNTQLAAGYTPAGTAGTPLFQYTSTGNTSTISVTSGFTGSDLAFSSDPATPGDSGNLTQLISIYSDPVTIPVIGTVTLSDAMTQIVGNLGTQSQENQDAATTAQTVRDQAESTWQSVSGVSSDEEAANLVTFQQMYQANMKVVQVADTLFTSALDMFNTPN